MTLIEQQLQKLAKDLDSLKSHIRKDAAEHLADCFQHLILARTAINPQLHESIVGKLLDRTLHEATFDMQETMFSTLIDALSYHLAERVDWNKLAQALSKLDPRLIEYALQALAFSHNMQYSALIKHYCDDSDSLIRQTAQESLVELQGK